MFKITLLVFFSLFPSIFLFPVSAVIFLLPSYTKYENDPPLNHVKTVKMAATLHNCAGV